LKTGKRKKMKGPQRSSQIGLPFLGRIANIAWFKVFYNAVVAGQKDFYVQFCQTKEGFLEGCVIGAM